MSVERMARAIIAAGEMFGVELHNPKLESDVQTQVETLLRLEDPPMMELAHIVQKIVTAYSDSGDFDLEAPARELISTVALIGKQQVFSMEHKGEVWECIVRKAHLPAIRKIILPGKRITLSFPKES